MTFRKPGFCGREISVARAAHEGDVVLFQEEVREEAAFLVHLHPAVDRDRCCDEERLCPLLHAKFEPERF